MLPPISLLSQALPPQGLNFPRDPRADAPFRREILPGERLALPGYEAAVAPDGRLRLRDGRRVPAVRRTLAELGDDLDLAVRRVPDPALPLLDPAHLGLVLRVPSGVSLLDALRGLTPPGTKTAAVLLVHADDRAERVPASAFPTVRLVPGDALALLPENETPTVAVLGGVARPGAYPWKEGATLGDAVAALGGLSARASADRVVIERAGRALGPFALPADAATALAPGDLVRIPVAGEASDYVSVAGYVKRPGLVELRPGARLADVLADAGGLTAPASALVVRVRSSRDARRKPLLLPATEVERCPPLQRGDIVEIGAPPAKASK